MNEKTFLVKGMTCSGCLKKVESVIRTQLPTAKFSINFESGVGQVRDSGLEDAQLLQNVKERVEEKGFHFRWTSTTIDVSQKNLWKKSLWIALASVFVCFFSPKVFGHSSEISKYISLTATLFAVLVGGHGFWLGAWAKLKQKTLGVDLLVLIGANAALGLSFYLWWSGEDHLYFFEASSIIAFISLGHYIEFRSLKKTEEALNELEKWVPHDAKVLLPNGEEQEIPLEDVKAESVLRVPKGEKFPLDGIVLEDAVVNESFLSGELEGVVRRSGEKVYAGSLNMNQPVRMQVASVKSQEIIDELSSGIRKISTAENPVQKRLDRISNVFIPSVLVASILTAILWTYESSIVSNLQEFLGKFLWMPISDKIPVEHFPLVAAISVLVVACPCALGLAFPSVLMAASNRSAKNGIVIRNALSFEAIRKLDRIVFDKTGTITDGQMGFHQVWTNEQVDEEEVQDILYHLAAQSSHPKSRSVVRNLNVKHRNCDWSDVSFEEFPGKGVKAVSGTDEFYWGSSAFLKESLCMEHERFEALEKGVFLASKKMGLLAQVVMQEKINTDFFRTLESLDQLNLKVSVLTGDSRGSWEKLMREASNSNFKTSTNHKIELLEMVDFHEELSPSQKLAKIEEWKKFNETVAFVGDGINDAPSLKAADLGIAVSRASDLSKMSSDVIFTKDRLSDLPFLLRLAKKSRNTLSSNLFWSFFYNTIAIPLAALGFLGPALCAFIMGFSDLVIVLNSLRILRVK